MDEKYEEEFDKVFEEKNDLIQKRKNEMTEVWTEINSRVDKKTNEQELKEVENDLKKINEEILKNSEEIKEIKDTFSERKKVQSEIEKLTKSQNDLLERKEECEEEIRDDGAGKEEARTDLEKINKEFDNVQKSLINNFRLRKTLNKKIEEAIKKYGIEKRLEDKEKISVENVFVYTRYFNQKKIELPYNEVDRKVDITELPCSTYVLNTICIKDEEKTYYTPRLTEELAKVTTLTVGDKIITFNSRYSILTIQKKNRFTLLKDGNKYLLGVNKPEDIKKIFFFNIENNKKYAVKKEGDFYTFSKESLQPGDNILMYETQDGNYTTVRKQEMTNSNLDKDFFDEVIISGRVEIEV